MTVQKEDMIPELFWLSFQTGMGHGPRRFPEIIWNVRQKNLARTSMVERVKQCIDHPKVKAMVTLDFASDIVRYRFPLLHETRDSTMAAMSFLAQLLAVGVADLRKHEYDPTEVPQLADVMIGRQALGGSIYPSLRLWLTKLGAKAKRQRGKLALKADFPDEVTLAMRAVWKAVALPDLKPYADECYARVSSDGRFIMGCCGNACDIAIYPETDYGGPEGNSRSEFSCHNLDNTMQQLTLFAGFAAMVSVAGKQLERQLGKQFSR